MHSLQPITALGGTEPQIDTIGMLTCREVPEVAFCAVAARLGHEAETTAIMSDMIGTALPGISKWVTGTLTAFWMGPDQWMIEAPISSHEDLADTLKARLGASASATEQTDAWTRFDLSGESVLSAMELLCALDARGMQSGDVGRSSVHHLGCFILCRSEHEFSLIGPRASAGSLHHAIVTAMHSVA